MSDGRARGRLAGVSTAAIFRARTALKRPTAMVESTRWLFWLLAMISLALSATAALAQGRGPMMPVALVAAAALAASLTAGYLRRRAVWGLDLLDAAAILALACSSPSPAAVFAVLFAIIWFRSLSGSTGGALLRCILYAAMMVLTLPLFPRIPGSSGPADPTIVLSSIPPMFVNFILARHLFTILRNVTEGAARDAIHAAAGSRLLGITDPDMIKQITWQAISDICAATPGLRVLGVSPRGDQLEVVLREGDVTKMPNLLSPRTRAILEADESGVTGLRDLDAAVGSPHEWQSLQILDPTVEGWLIVGTRRRAPTQAVDTVAGVVALSVLALRNSQAHEELTAQATLDNLTGLANRKLFNTVLSEALANARGTETAVLFVDLDDFKDVNDMYGHSAGDEMLREVSARIKAATRAEDLCARLGGDEFAILLPDTGAAEATEVARRIVDAVSGPLELSHGVAQVGASVGLAVDAGDLSPEHLVQRADIAMYAAKAGGKGRMQPFAVGLLQDDPGSVCLGHRLEAATENDELVVH